MSNIKVEKYELGLYMANCYLIWNNNHVIMIDPGSTSRKLVQHLTDCNASVDAILLTHGHFDHIGGVDMFASKFKCPVYIDSEDVSFLTNPNLNCSLPGKSTIVSTKVKTIDSNVLNINGLNIEVIYASGHTNGCVMYKIDEHLFTGDVLFKGSIGRCDLPTGSNHKMMDTLNHIKTMDSSLLIYPGHGDISTLDFEFKYNPYL